MADVDEVREEARRNTRARFEQWAKNPACAANTLSAVHNVRLDKAAESIGLDPSFGQSPFAIARGNAFEAGLFAADAARLRTALERKACLPSASSGFLDLRLRMNGGPSVRTVDEALDRTRQWLADLAAGRGEASIVAAPMVRIPRGVILPEALLILDVATVTRDAMGPIITVGEIKAFPDRGGHTDAGQLAAARAQAGLYRLALEMAIEADGLTDRIRLTSHGFLVFTWPGSNQPSVRTGEDLTYQALRASRGFEQLERAALALVRPDDYAADQPELIRRVHSRQTRTTAKHA